MITKEEFLRVYNSYKPNWFILLLYGFHKPSLTKTGFPYNKYVKYFLLLMFLLGWLGTAAGFSRGFIGTFTWIFMAGIAGIVILTFIASFMNNARLRKVMKKLGIDLQEYNKLTKEYL